METKAVKQVKELEQSDDHTGLAQTNLSENTMVNSNIITQTTCCNPSITVHRLCFTYDPL